MGVSGEDVEVLERAVVGLPQVAEALVPLAPEDKERALAAVERAYQKAATEFGYSQPEAEGWAANITLDLRAEIEKQSVSI
jgi:hypothetical protein